MSAAAIHNYGTDDGWHGKIEEGGEFPPEKDRYHLYIGTISFELFSFRVFRLPLVFPHRYIHQGSG